MTVELASPTAAGTLDDVTDGRVGGVDIGSGEIMRIPDGEVSIWIADSSPKDDQDWLALVTSRS